MARPVRSSQRARMRFCFRFPVCILFFVFCICFNSFEFVSHSIIANSYVALITWLRSTDHMASPHLVVFLTGASRGLGRAFALEFARAYGSGAARLSLVFFARDGAGLAATAASVRSIAPSAAVLAHEVDLSAAGCTGVTPAWTSALAAVAASAPSMPPTRAVLVHNAGSLGPLGEQSSLISEEPEALRKYLDLNLTSVVLLTRLFLSGLRARSQGGFLAESVGGSTGADAGGLPAHHLIVNVSSLAAVKPMATWGMYAVTRAARDMLGAVVAAEEAGAVKVLSYAPGPCDTDMQRECRESPGLEAASKEYLTRLHADGGVIDPLASAARCLRLIAADSYASGAHVDYYDAEDATNVGGR